METTKAINTIIETARASAVDTPHEEHAQEVFEALETVESLLRATPDLYEALSDFKGLFEDLYINMADEYELEVYNAARKALDGTGQGAGDNVVVWPIPAIMTGEYAITSLTAERAPIFERETGIAYRIVDQDSVVRAWVREIDWPNMGQTPEDSFVRQQTTKALTEAIIGLIAEGGA